MTGTFLPSLSVPLRRNPWRFALYAGLAVVVAVNLFGVALMGALILTGSDALDWHTYRAAVERYPSGDLYSGEWWYGWRYSPIAVPLFALVTWAGEPVWRLLHFVALLALPGWTRWIALASYPFWFDVAAGNVMVFVLVAAYWALRGNRWGIGVTLALSLLIPRPLALPLVAWIMWQKPVWRLPFAALFLVHAVAVLATGYADDWMGVLIGAGAEVGSTVNIGPSALIGSWWMLAALPLCAFALWRGYPATAGLLLQPYWLPYYLLMPLADHRGVAHPADAHLPCRNTASG